MSLVLAVTTRVEAQQVPENLVIFKSSTINRSVQEDVGTITVTLQRLNPVGTDSRTRVYGVGVGPSSIPADFSLPDYPKFPPSTADFGSATELDITVQINQDAEIEGTEDFYVVIGGSSYDNNVTIYPGEQLPGSGEEAGPPLVGYDNQRAGKITIIDVPPVPGDPGTIHFSASTYSVSEDEGTARINVQRSGSDAETAQITFSTSDGTGEAGVKYTTTNTTLSWGVGENSVKTVDVPVFHTYPDATVTWDDNSDNEGGFAIERSLNGGGWVSLGTVGQNVTTYVDRDININDSRQYRVRSFNSDGNSSWATSATYTFPGGNFDKTVNLTLSNPVNATLSSPSTAVLTIEDVETASGVVNFLRWREDSKITEVTEGGVARLWVVRENPLGDCSVRLHTKDINPANTPQWILDLGIRSASERAHVPERAPNVDYELRDRFPANVSREYFTGSQTELFIDIQTYDDTIIDPPDFAEIGEVEPDEIFWVKMGSVDNCTFDTTLDSNGQEAEAFAVVIIHDND